MPELADVVIVGAGLLGLTLACELARHTMRVVLLDQSRPATGATGSGFAWVNATSKLENESYHRLNAEGLAHYSRLAAEHGADQLGIHGGWALFWMAPGGTLGAPTLVRKAETLRAWQYPAILLDSGEMRALEPQVSSAHVDGAVGMFAPADLWIDTPRLVRYYVECAMRYKVDLRPDCPATGFTWSVSGAISTVETPDRRIATRLLVLTSGIETSSLAARATGDPGMAAMCPVRRAPGLLIETGATSGPNLTHRVLFPPDAGGLHLRPTPGGGMLIGADDTDAALMDGKSGIGPGPSEEGKGWQESGRKAPDFRGAAANLLSRARAALGTPRDPNDATMLDARICIRPVPHDGLPIAGLLPGDQGVHVLVTHSGITLGPMLAHLLADEIVIGRPSPQLSPYRPGRFARNS